MEDATRLDEEAPHVRELAPQTSGVVQIDERQEASRGLQPVGPQGDRRDLLIEILDPAGRRETLHIPLGRGGRKWSPSTGQARSRPRRGTNGRTSGPTLAAAIAAAATVRLDSCLR